MRTTWGAWDLDARMLDRFSCLSEVIDQVISGIGAPWDRGSHGPGPGHWGGGGFGGWWPGPTGTQRGAKAGRGDVRAAILALLKEGPRTGYQIMSDIKERSSGAWRPSPGAV